MIIAFIFAVSAFSLTAVLHLGVLHRLLLRFDKSDRNGAGVWIGAFLLIGALHLIEAGIYGIALKMGQVLGLGGFESAGRVVSTMDSFYFALVTYTSLGLGDIYPTGHLRFIAGVASLNGFLLISCSAAFLFRIIRIKKTK
ncbi:MAG: ion channel [Litorimonas sp.]